MRVQKFGKRERWASVAGLFLVAVGISILVLNFRHQPVQTPAAGAPSANKPSNQAVESYSVAPDRPKYLNVPALGVSKARVVALGLLKNNQIAVPDNIYDTGWYNGSAKPGQPGAMFIYGHVSNWKANGIFYDLKKLKPGDKLTVERGDGQHFSYTVKSGKTYPADKVDMKAVLAPVAAGKQGLNLMTCAGSINKRTGEFSERLVVFASRD